MRSEEGTGLPCSQRLTSLKSDGYGLRGTTGADDLKRVGKQKASICWEGSEMEVSGLVK